MRDHVMERPPLAKRLGTHLGEVVSVKDTTGRGRIQVRLIDHDGVSDQDAPIWARVAVPFAGSSSGAFFIPNKGDEVLINFINGDPRLPIVVGALWNGGAKQPEQLGGDGESVDRWTIVGKNGTRIAIVEEQAGAVIKFSTPNGVTGTLTDQNGGKIELKGAGNTVTVDNKGVSVNTSNKVKVSAGKVEITAGQVKVDTVNAEFTGMVSCKTLKTEFVNSKAYTQGVGNVW